MKKNLIKRSVGYAAMAGDMWKLKRSDSETVIANARRHLSERMGKLHGLPQKIGQIMSMSSDVAQAVPFKELFDQAQPMPFTIVSKVLADAWQASPDSMTTYISPDARAASLGQVHRASLVDGRDVAIKVAYPGIEKAILNDLKMIGWLSSPVGDLRRRFNLVDYRQEIIRDLKEELDYNKEIQHQQRFTEVAANMDGLIVPQVHKKLSNKHVLVADWQDGETIDQVMSWSASVRGELGWVMLRHFLTLLFDHGLVHGDPHPGNYRFRQTASGPEVILYDFGSVLKVSSLDRLLILKLMTESAAKIGDPLATLSALGFDDTLLEPIQGKLPAVCSVLFEPFASPMKFDLTQWNRKLRMDDILGDDRWNFRMAGPSKLILLMRAFRGILYYLEKIGEPVSWERVLQPILKTHQANVQIISLKPSPSPQSTFNSMAKHLRIEVLRDGVKKVSLTFPVLAIEDVRNLMGEEVLERIEQEGTDIDQIVKEARAGGYKAIELFCVKDMTQEGQRRVVRVWLQ